MILKKISTLLTVACISAVSLLPAFDAISYIDDTVPGFSVDPCYDCPPETNWFVNADFLYWKATTHGLSYGTVIPATGPKVGEIGVIAAEGTSHVKEVHFRWDPAFRIGFGYRFPCDCWELEAAWTHFKTHANGQMCISDATHLFIPAYGLRPVIFTEAQDTPSFVKARWKLRVELIDVDLAKTFCLSPCFSLKPHIGLRVARIDQKYKIQIDGFTGFDDAESFVTFENKERLRTEFLGIGIRAGFDTEWSLGCGFTLYSDAAASIVFGKSKSYHAEEFLGQPFFAEESILDVNINQKDHHRDSLAMTDLTVGLRWKHFFNCDEQALTIQAGWEHHILFDANKFERSAYTEVPLFAVDTQNRNNSIALQGLVISGRLDF